MNGMELTIDANKLQQAILKAPDKLEANLNKAITRTIREMARSAREHASKAFSTLVQSIRSKKISTLEGQVAPGTNYAEAVERGTGVYGPAGVASGKLPPVDNIEDWVKVAGIQPREIGQTQRDVAWLIARKIAVTGTKPQPYMQPAFDDNAKRAEARINKAISNAISESGG